MNQRKNDKMSRLQAPSPNRGIYVHIPFCRSRCGYCSFVSQVHRSGNEEGYFDALCAEIREKETFFEKADTIYIGGGTPSAVSPKNLERTVYELKNRYDASSLREFTIEMNPESATREKISFYKSVGVDRFSLGVQSFDNRVLKILGRVHSRREIVRALELFGVEDNLTIDLIWGVTGFRQNISFIDDYPIKHVSTYLLTLEEKTPLFNAGYRVKGDSYVEKEYFMLLEELYKRGFERYEVSNFAKRGFESVHNSAYWETDSVYAGYGVSAASYDTKRRIQNTDSIEDYISSGGRLEYAESVDLKKNSIEKIMLSMRTVKGLKVTGEIREHLDFNKVDSYVKSGKLRMKSETLSFTERGFLIMNYVLSDILF
ncbi:MAG: radical SAM family heme chaperone HemW [bacterium]|nr:radical SAM family heme chaperone HemW [bacterium]